MKKILIWDYNGTITPLKDPNDTTHYAKGIMPGVRNAMEQADLNVIISGYKSVESEKQDYDPDKVIASFTNVMMHLPVSVAAFSPERGGMACYVLIKKGDVFSVMEAHKLPQYQYYKGFFKKPEVGMFVVMKDVIAKYFGMKLAKQTGVMIGDTWHDEQAAQDFGIPFISAETIHTSSLMRNRSS